MRELLLLREMRDAATTIRGLRVIAAPSWSTPTLCDLRAPREGADVDVFQSRILTGVAGSRWTGVSDGRYLIR